MYLCNLVNKAKLEEQVFYPINEDMYKDTSYHKEISRYYNTYSTTGVFDISFLTFTKLIIN